jgi:hypothetical protein
MKLNLILVVLTVILGACSTQVQAPEMCCEYIKEKQETTLDWFVTI